MTAVHSRYVMVDGIRTHYLEGGDGPAVVLLNSGEFGGCAELSWEFNTPKPKINSGQSYSIPFGIRGFLETGAYTDFGQGFVAYSAFKEEELLSIGTLGLATAVGLYDVTASSGSYEIQANAGIYQDGAELNSYQVD